MTDRVWKYATEVALPRVIVVNQCDHPKAGSGMERKQLIEAMQSKWGRQVVPLELPIVDEKGFHGVVDLVTMKSYLYESGGNGRGEAGPIPAALEGDARKAHEELVELVAEGKDELMEEFFREGTIPEEHLIAALHEAVREDRIFDPGKNGGGFLPWIDGWALYREQGHCGQLHKVSAGEIKSVHG